MTANAVTEMLSFPYLDPSLSLGIGPYPFKCCLWLYACLPSK